MSDIIISYEKDNFNNEIKRKVSRIKVILSLVSSAIFLLIYFLLFGNSFPILVPFFCVIISIIIILPISIICEINFKRFKILRILFTLIALIFIPSLLILCFDILFIHFYGMAFIPYFIISIVFFILEEITKNYSRCGS